jgi:hypothetical protein
MREVKGRKGREVLVKQATAKDQDPMVEMKISSETRDNAEPTVFV